MQICERAAILESFLSLINLVGRWSSVEVDTTNGNGHFKFKPESESPLDSYGQWTVPEEVHTNYSMLSPTGTGDGSP